MAESKSSKPRGQVRGKPNKTNLGRHRRRGSIFPFVLGITIIAGFVIGAKSYSIAYDEVAKRSVLAQNEEEGEERFSANNIVQQAQNNLVGSDIDGVIKDISLEDSKVTFYNLKSNETIILTATEDTQYPYPNTINDYKIGDVVTYVYDEDRNLTDIKVCENAWEFSDTGLTVNADSKLLKFGEASSQYQDKAFKYTDGITTVRYNDEYTTLDKIDPIDYVTVRGYDNGTQNKAYSVTIEKSHGMLEIHNSEQIQDGKLKLNEQELSLSSAKSMKLTEGRYSIEVTGSNCETYTTDVLVNADATATVDLSVVQIKSGLVDIVTNVPDCTIYIDGTVYDTDESILLDYGKYNLKVTKSDYEDYTGTFTVNQDVNTVNVSLKEKEKTGTINITTNPGSAKIYVDGVFKGQSPQNVTVTLGTHTIETRMDGYIDELRRINVGEEGATVKCEIGLTPIVAPYSETKTEAEETS